MKKKINCHCWAFSEIFRSTLLIWQKIKLRLRKRKGLVQDWTATLQHHTPHPRLLRLLLSVELLKQAPSQQSQPPKHAQPMRHQSKPPFQNNSSKGRMGYWPGTEVRLGSSPASGFSQLCILGQTPAPLWASVFCFCLFLNKMDLDRVKIWQFHSFLGGKLWEDLWDCFHITSFQSCTYPTEIYCKPCIYIY